MSGSASGLASGSGLGLGLGLGTGLGLGLAAHRVWPARVRLELLAYRVLVHPAGAVGGAHALLAQRLRSPHQVLPARLLGSGLGLGVWLQGDPGPPARLVRIRLGLGWGLELGLGSGSVLRGGLGLSTRPPACADVRLSATVGSAACAACAADGGGGGGARALSDGAL